MISRLFTIMLVVLGVAMMMAVPMFAAPPSGATGGGGGTADGGGLVAGMDSGMENLWTVLKGISYGVAVVFVAVAAFKLIIGGQKGMEAAKSDLIKAIIFAAIIILAPAILQTIFGWFSGADSSFSNPFTT
jgi:hypothetical protein